MERARGLRLPAVFVLTTRTIDWFESIGFTRVEVAKLPEEKRRRYDADRRSVVLRYSFENE